MRRKRLVEMTQWVAKGAEMPNNGKVTLRATLVLAAVGALLSATAGLVGYVLGRGGRPTWAPDESFSDGIGNKCVWLFFDVADRTPELIVKLDGRLVRGGLYTVDLRVMGPPRHAVQMWTDKDEITLEVGPPGRTVRKTIEVRGNRWVIYNMHRKTLVVFEDFPWLR